MDLPRPAGTHTLRAAGLLLALAIAAMLLLGPFAGRARAGGKSPQVSLGTTLVETSFSISGLNAIERDAGKVFCPTGLVPYGGAVMTPPPAANGAGAYPQTFERLGGLHGFHSTVVDFAPPGTTGLGPLRITVQLTCGPKLKGMSPVQNSIFINPGETKSVQATCPDGKLLVGGAFQRTDFTGDGGDFATASWAVSTSAWMATGHAFGAFGGELNATAFCAPGKPNYEAESGAVAIPPHGNATATSPACPGRTQLVFGGFGTDPAGSVLFGNSSFNIDKTYSASGYNLSDAPANIIAESYCLQFPKPAKRHRRHRHHY